MQDKPFRILTIDGGGLRGIYAAQIIKRIQDEFNIKFSEYFDLIAGTSTGAILASALAIDKDINEIITLYEECGKAIFCKKAIFGFTRSKYSQQVLEELLKKSFQEITMSQTNTNLMIFATDIGNASPFVIKTPYNKDFTRDKNIKIYEAILASTAAPIYFDPYLLTLDNSEKYLLADGGLWCNNPSISAIAEARKYFNKELNEIEILSIGTIQGKSSFNVSKKNFFNWGLMGWNIKLIDTLMNMQSLASENMSIFIKPARYLRINTKETHVIPMDKANLIPDFKSKAGEKFTYMSKEIRDFFDMCKKIK